jgi:N6-L-threonylcarbamoyladenine synthase
VLILGIESSCDETAAAVVRDGNEILSSVISSQIELHKPYGGVVPEIASRDHLSKIDAIVEESLGKAGVTLDEIDAIAVTQGPGLIGSLLVGVCYAKALAFGRGLPMVGVNHIEGHFYSVVFENPPIEYPALALIVSGGHTNLFHVSEEGRYKIVSRTRDDAAGEAFDKAAKMLGLGYPGGPVIEKIAASGNPTAMKFTRPKISDGRPDFSFSGLKTALSKLIKAEAQLSDSFVADVSASFQHAIVEQLAAAMKRAVSELPVKTLIVAGGVACNLTLRDAMAKVGETNDIPVYFQSKHLSTDNAAMIAAAGYAKFVRNETAPLNITADITLRLQNVENNDKRLKGKVRYKL